MAGIACTTGCDAERVDERIGPDNNSAVDATGESPESTPQMTPKLDPELRSLTFGAAPETAIDFQVTANVSWSVAAEYENGEPAWLSVDPASGSTGKTTVTVTADKNTSPTSRHAALVFVSGDLKERVAVEQLEIEPSLTLCDFPSVLFEADQTAESTIRFETNAEWRIEVNHTSEETGWLRIAPDRGEAGACRIVLTVTENLSGAARSAEIAIVYAEKSCKLVVQQSGLNLADRFDPLFARELQRRGYIANACRIVPEAVKSIESVEVFGRWIASEDRYDGELTSLRGIEYFTSLKHLYCWGNKITELDVSDNPALTDLRVYGNRISALDVSGNPSLRVLKCHDNGMTSLRLGDLPALYDLVCGDNLLESVDVTACPNLKFLLCEDNRLTSLDISGNPQLRNLDCFNNPGDGAFFPVRCRFDNQTVPEGMYLRFTTGSWTFEGHEIAIDYRKVE